MTFSANWPDGTKSVKVNRAQGNINMSYVIDQMQKDHYWIEDATKDGHHRKVDMPKLDTAPTLVNDGIVYAMDTSDTVTEVYYTNNSTTYQLSPTFKSGTKTLGSNYVTVDSVPADVYGEIIMWRGSQIQTGTFISTADTVYTFSTLIKIKSNTDSRPRFVEFGNGSDASGFNIQAKIGSGSSGTAGDWLYRITYRDV